MKRDILLILLAITFWMGGTALISQATAGSVPIEEELILDRPATEWNYLELPSAGISVSMSGGGIKGGKWLMSEREALYWQENGAIVVYGHNSKNILADLKNVKAGDELSLTSTQGVKQNYQVYQIETISPQDVERISSDNPAVVIMTCTGWWDEKRLIVKAKAI